MNALELKVPPGALLIAIAGAMWLTSAWLPSLAFVLPGRLVVVGALGLAGIGFAVAGVMAFRRAETTVNPMRPGSASAVVTSGAYRWSRNPMYVGLLLVLAGWAAFLSHPLAFLFLPAFVGYLNRFQILPEERALTAKFGAEFAAYRQSVRRWL